MGFAEQHAVRVEGSLLQEHRCTPPPMSGTRAPHRFPDGKQGIEIIAIAWADAGQCRRTLKDSLQSSSSKA